MATQPAFTWTHRGDRQDQRDDRRLDPRRDCDRRQQRHRHGNRQHQRPQHVRPAPALRSWRTSPYGLQDPTLAALLPTLLNGSGGALTYSDMLQIFQTVERKIPC